MALTPQIQSDNRPRTRTPEHPVSYPSRGAPAGVVTGRHHSISHRACYVHNSRIERPFGRSQERSWIGADAPQGSLRSFDRMPQRGIGERNHGCPPITLVAEDVSPSHHSAGTLLVVSEPTAGKEERGLDVAMAEHSQHVVEPLLACLSVEGQQHHLLLRSHYPLAGRSCRGSRCSGRKRDRPREAQYETGGELGNQSRLHQRGILSAPHRKYGRHRVRADYGEVH